MDAGAREGGNENHFAGSEPFPSPGPYPSPRSTFTSRTAPYTHPLHFPSRSANIVTQYSPTFSPTSQSFGSQSYRSRHTYDDALAPETPHAAPAPRELLMNSQSQPPSVLSLPSREPSFSPFASHGPISMHGQHDLDMGSETQLGTANSNSASDGRLSRHYAYGGGSMGGVLGSLRQPDQDSTASASHAAISVVPALQDGYTVSAKDKTRRHESDAEESHQPEVTRGSTAKLNRSASKKQKKAKANSGRNKESKEAKSAGRQKGSRNFSVQECTRLVDIWCQHLPAGQQDVQECTDMYNVWARSKSFLERDVKTLKSKIDRIADMKPPTGAPNMASYIQKAKEMKYRTCERTGAGTISDGDGDAQSLSSSDDTDDEGSSANQNVTTAPLQALAEWNKGPATRTRAPASNVRDALLTAFSPEARAARDASKVELQTTSALFISQIADLRRTIHQKDERIRELENLVSRTKDKLHYMERQLDKAKNEHALTRLRLEFQSQGARHRRPDFKGGYDKSASAHSPPLRHHKSMHLNSESEGFSPSRNHSSPIIPSSDDAVAHQETY